MPRYSGKDLLVRLRKYPGREAIKTDLWYDLIADSDIWDGVSYILKIDVALSDLQSIGAALTGQVDLFDLPAGCQCTTCWYEVTEALLGPGPLTAATASIGPSGSTTAWQTVQNIFALGIRTVNGADLDGTNCAVYSTSVATTIELDLALTGCNGEDLTAGALSVYVKYQDYSVRTGQAPA